jgi:hypothetical protein
MRKARIFERRFRILRSRSSGGARRVAKCLFLKMNICDIHHPAMACDVLEHSWEVEDRRWI